MKKLSLEQKMDAYLEAKAFAWSLSTQKSESSRLNSVLPYLNGDPHRLWEGIQGLQPYSRLTVWTRVCDFYDWQVSNDLAPSNEYKAFRAKNAKLFKNVYEKKTPKIGLEDAKARIETIQDEDVRKKAYQILMSGLRWTESLGSVPNHAILGKGGKIRQSYGPACEYRGSYSKFLRALRAVGLKPHDLRKICLTELVRRGMNSYDLCAFAGWSSIETASSYIQADDRKIRELVEGLK